MLARAAQPRCMVAGCGAPASHQFLAGAGGDWSKVTDEHGRRVRACRGHFLGVVGRLQEAMAALPGGGPARLRAVELVPAG